MTTTHLARLAMRGLAPDAIAATLPPDAHTLRALLAQHRAALAQVAALAIPIAEAHAADPARQRAAFDAIAAIAPDLGCATYALNDPALLAAATAEVMDWLTAKSLVRGHATDIGCGTGRFARALAEAGCTVDAYDTSPNMLAAARSHTPIGPGHGGPDPVRYHLSPGVIAPSPSDLILFADSLPYLVAAGTAAAQFEAAARALTPGGAIVALNLSYRDKLAADWADARRWAQPFRLRIEYAEPFVAWDAAAWVFRHSHPRHQ